MEKLIDRLRAALAQHFGENTFVLCEGDDTHAEFVLQRDPRLRFNVWTRETEPDSYDVLVVLQLRVLWIFTPFNVLFDKENLNLDEVLAVFANYQHGYRR